MSDIVYKIVPADLWQEAELSGVFGGAPIDLTDGYIHFSTAMQSRRTAELYFMGQDDLLMVAVDGASLGEALKYEQSRGGDLFPHLYGPLPLSAVIWKKPLVLRDDGSHEFPDGFA